MKYAIKRNDGKYVAKPGRKSSYTDTLQNAQLFSTREQAEKERCIENEHVVEVDL